MNNNKWIGKMKNQEIIMTKFGFKVVLLVQQRIKKYPPQKKKNHYIYPWIKDDIKSRSKIDLGCCSDKKFGHKYRNPQNHPYYETRVVQVI